MSRTDLAIGFNVGDVYRGCSGVEHYCFVVRSVDVLSERLKSGRLKVSGVMLGIEAMHVRREDFEGGMAHLYDRHRRFDTLADHFMKLVDVGLIRLSDEVDIG